ncbi:hypothetical protein TNCV_352251 [Trichonephila clavipes]|nr:hypothetical protein TNCV_352251 [Trichonephila clavipes]
MRIGNKHSLLTRSPEASSYTPYPIRERTEWRRKKKKEKDLVNTGMCYGARAAGVRYSYLESRLWCQSGKAAAVGRKGLSVGACVPHLQVCEETRAEDNWRILRQWCSNELRIKDRLIWAHQ